MAVTLIVGDEKEYQIHCIAVRLREMGSEVRCLQLSDFPLKNAISWQPDCGQGYLHLNNESFSFNDIKSVYWHRAQACQSEQATTGNWLKKEVQSALSPLLNCLSIRWINPISALQYHQNKPRQLNHAVRLGAVIPPTYIGNNPRCALDFLRQHSVCIFKPVQGGALTQPVCHKQRHMDHLQSALRLAPVTLQAKVGTSNVRTFVLGNTLLSAELKTDYLDFREDSNVQVHVVTLPDNIANLARRICRGFGMIWCAIDWRIDAYGQFYFLEANPCPHFYRFEQLTGLPVSEELGRLLLH
ncbi:hypothetical protein DRW07_17940 [Alteromonas sediminis]|uniref:ATP-grasp domain-containing protein n=1 Tax=Alteromonas sediminis TaxID=2259342 RepID=A0A3N5Y8J5_9ALTE|nr:hypothetical protein [Alteromonas sediminis]RPJ64805.1 hypothetical protein DRW07_17940 [Alteromonas sediminis]